MVCVCGSLFPATQMGPPMETTKQPRVSILLPTYNRAALLRRAVQSVFRQSFPDWELIVLDDGSTDGTEAMLKEFMGRDHRITTIRNPKNENAGIAKFLDKGLAAAKGEYIARLDDDDYWIDDDKLKKQVAFLDSHPDYVVVGTGVRVINKEGKELSRYFKR